MIRHNLTYVSDEEIGRTSREAMSVEDYQKSDTHLITGNFIPDNLINLLKNKEEGKILIDLDEVRVRHPEGEVDLYVQIKIYIKNPYKTLEGDEPDRLYMNVMRAVFKNNFPDENLSDRVGQFEQRVQTSIAHEWKSIHELIRL